MEPKKKIVVEGKEGLVTKEKEQAEIITDFFEKMFSSEDAEEMPHIPPTEMRNPFATEEIEKAVKSLKNDKSAGRDELKAQMIKYGPAVMCQGIAEVFNEMAKTGKHPQQVNHDILIPLQKSGKKPRPPGHLQPIILLSILRKILTICMIRRIAGKIYQLIPVTQAAYRERRSTTELIFIFKVLAEKAITSKEYKL